MSLDPHLLRADPAPPLQAAFILAFAETRRRWGETNNGSAALVSPLENGDLVANSLVLLPALPSSLVSASLVRKRWFRCSPTPVSPRIGPSPEAPSPRHLLLQHGKNKFHSDAGSAGWIPVIRRFAFEVPTGTKLLCCHHGRLLMHVEGQQYFLVWEPITGELCPISEPPSFSPYQMTLTAAALVCASTDQGHIHCACYSDPFQVVILAEDTERFYDCVYSSKTKAWGNLFSIMRPPQLRTTCAVPMGYGTQIFRNSICLLLIEEKIAILEFDWSKAKPSYY